MDQTIGFMTKGVIGLQPHSEQVVNACRELGTRWPGKSVLAACARSHVETLSDGTGQFRWGEFVSAVLEDRETSEFLATTEKGPRKGKFLRRGAMRALVVHWPDETTRKLLAERALRLGGLGAEGVLRHGVGRGHEHHLLLGPALAQIIGEAGGAGGRGR